MVLRQLDNYVGKDETMSFIFLISVNKINLKWIVNPCKT